MPAGSTKPCTTALAREPPPGRGLSARRKCAACATAPCSVMRRARCGPAAVTSCTSCASRASGRRR
eukprot:7211581-Lingulodinium_polyedra.AAC.2